MMFRICWRGHNVQLKIKDGKLRLHHSNNRLKSGYFFSVTVDNVFQPDAEFDIAGSKPMQVVSGAAIHMKQGTDSL